MAASDPIPFVRDKSGNNPARYPFDQYNRTNAGDPAAITPLYAGERILDVTNGTLYQALGTAANTWVQITI